MFLLSLSVLSLSIDATQSLRLEDACDFELLLEVEIPSSKLHLDFSRHVIDMTASKSKVITASMDCIRKKPFGNRPKSLKGEEAFVIARSSSESSVLITPDVLAKPEEIATHLIVILENRSSPRRFSIFDVHALRPALTFLNVER